MGMKPSQKYFVIANIVKQSLNFSGIHQRIEIAVKKDKKWN